MRRTTRPYRAGVAKRIRVSALYSNGEKADVTCSCAVSSSFSGFSFSGSSFTVSDRPEDELGTLEVSYSDPDFPELEKATLTKYMKLIANGIVALSADIPSSISYDGMAGPQSVAYSVKGARRLGGAVDLTSTAVISVNNGEGVSFSGGVMSVDPGRLTDGQLITLLISDPSTPHKAQMAIRVSGSQPKGLTVKVGGLEEGFVAHSGEQGVPFSVTARMANGEDGPADGASFRCISSDKVTVQGGRISFGEFSEDEYVTFLASYEFHGKALLKYVTVLVKAVRVMRVSVVGDTEVKAGTTHSYMVKADLSNGETGVDVTGRSSIRVAFGDPDCAEISGGSPIAIGFKGIGAASACMAFLAEDTESGKTKAFTVKIVR